MNRRARLTLLLASLGISIVALLSARTNVFSRTSAEGQASRFPCQADAPPLAEVSLREIVLLRANLLPVIAPLAKKRYAVGIVPTEDVWSDDTPQRIRESRLAGGGFPASFEMRVWAERPKSIVGLDVVADVFLFDDPIHAHRFFEEAAGTYCHPHSSTSSTPRPPRARDLIWTNPLNVTEEDVFLLRGSLVYRVGTVTARRNGLATVNRLACELPEAGCATRATRAAPSRGAARPSARSSSRRQSDRATGAGTA
jgi:hypothetical protein